MTGNSANHSRDPAPESGRLVLAALTALVLSQGCSNSGSDNAPPFFVKLEPVEGQTIHAGAVSLSYRATDPEGGDVLYDVHIGTSASALQPLASLTAEEHVASGLLAPRTRYFWKVVATDPLGARRQSPIQAFTTGDRLTVIDIDGNEYVTVQIGTQVWMAENLKTRTYRNGEPITNLPDNQAWVDDQEGAWCEHPDPGFDESAYGLLYNWYAVANPNGLAPEGWHVPTDDEWATLMDYLGGDSVAGGLLKETGFDHWFAPNTGASNGSGFTARGGGHRETWDGDFDLAGYNGFFWSASDISSHSTNFRGLGNRKINAGRYTALKNAGFSVRCLADADQP